MLKKIAVKFPQSGSAVTPNYLVLMYLYIDPIKFAEPGTLTDTKLKNIRAVELFSPYENAPETDLIFLPTIEKHTFAEFEEADDDDLSPWKLFEIDENGDQRFLLNFLPELELVTFVRCPLLGARMHVKIPENINEKLVSRDIAYREVDFRRNYQLRFKFEFRDTAKPNDKWYRFKSFETYNGDNSPGSIESSSEWMRPGGSGGATAKFPISDGRSWGYDKDDNRVSAQPTNCLNIYERNPPKLLYWREFCRGPFPVGKHGWNVSFQNLGERSNGGNQTTIWGLEIKYYCSNREDSGNGWGRKEEDASRLFPLDIAPVHNSTFSHPNEYALRILAQPDAKQFQKTNQSKWLLEVNWFYQPPEGTPNLPPGHSFTPLGALNKKVTEPYLNSLSGVKGSGSGSVLPHFGTLENAANQKWTLKYAVEDKRPYLPTREIPSEVVSVDDFDINFKTLDFGVNSSDVDLSVKSVVSLKNFLDYDGKPVKRIFRIEPTRNITGSQTRVCLDEDGANEAPSIHLSLIDLQSGEPQQLPPPDNAGQISRVGALDLHFAAQPAPASAGVKTGKLIFKFDKLGKMGSEAAVIRHTNIEAELFYHLSAFSPGGQDPTPLEDLIEEADRPNTIIAPFTGSEASIKGNFYLVARERCSREFSHTLSMRLERVAVANPGGAADAPNRLDFVVIDQNPFLVARVRTQMDFSNEIGNWSGAAVEGASWELRDNSKGFDLILPPQVIGEEFIKDYVKQFEEGQPINYKFSPVAKFRLSRTPFAQNFSESPWNIRRLLGYPGQRMPGMGIFELTFELLYGLTTTVTTENLRLAEIEALIGRLPGFLSNESPFFSTNKTDGSLLDSHQLVKEYCEYRNQYKRLHQLIRQRLSLLMPWSPLQNSSSGLVLENGVNFRFRASRKVAHPLERRGVAGYFEHPQGLRGGVDWGFESQNIYDEVLKQPLSTSSKLVNPSFTALGGNGFQRAGFANDKSKIYSDTFLGRTFFYSLERIGRIGSLWNHAKHVIVYERSVADSKQFPELDDLGRPIPTPMSKWRGRAVVRKLEEFVEIMQPERYYLEEFDNDPKDCGFVHGSKFSDKIIKVDGKWGHDVPGGWVVPLYMPGADPEVYKEPDIYLQMATSSETGKKHCWARIKNPEVLRFYTSTNSKDSINTDAWAAAPDVDFPIEDLFNVPAVDPQVNKATDSSLPDPPAQHPGYERFTFQLDTSAQTANIISGRSDKSTEALIENVSLIRRSLKEFTGGKNPSNEGRRRINEAVEQGTSFVKEVQTQAAKIADILQNANPASVLGNFETTLRQKLSDANVKYQTLPTPATWIHEQQKKKILDWSASLPANTESWIANLKDDLSRYNFALGGAEIIESAKDDVRRVFNEIVIKLKAAELEFDKLQQSVNRALLFVSAGYDEVFGLIEHYRVLLTETVAQQDLAEYRRLAVEFAGKFQQSIIKQKSALGGSYPTLYSDTSTKLMEAVKRSVEIDEVVCSIGLMPSEFPVEDDLDAVAQWFEDVEIEESLDQLLLLYDTYLAEREEESATINQLVKELRDKIERFFAQSRLEAIIAEIVRLAKTNIGAALNKASEELNNLKNQVRSAYDEIAQKLAEQNVVNIIKNVFGDKAQLQAQIQAQINAAKDFIDKLVKLKLNTDDAAVVQAYRNLIASAPAALTSALAPYEQIIKEQAQVFDRQYFGAEIEQLRGRALRLVRAYGLAPISEGLKLNRERVAYYFQELQNGVYRMRDVVDFTPATVLVNRLGRELEQFDLKSVGIRLPSFSVGDKFLPVDFSQLRPDLRDILPDFAGLNLASLFEGVDFPTYASESVKITHGFNPTTLKAWAQCDVDLPLAGETELFNLGLFRLTVGRSSFTARTRIDADSSGAPRRSVEASIKADWKLSVGSEMVITITDATLHFNNSGRLSFKMKPQSLVLAQALTFLTDLMQTLRPSGNSGLSLGLIFDGMIPVGIRALLNLALPTIGVGAYSISNLALAANFEIGAPGGEFYLGVGLGICSKERPFNLSILFLGGGGWFNVTAFYRPFNEGNRLSALLSIGISAGASVAFDIGVAAGGVYFLVSLGVEYFYGGGNNALTILLRIQLSGEVVILGFISVGLMLALEARYTRGGALTCTGTLRLSIKIGWFFKISINKEVTFTLAGKQQAGTQQFDTLDAAAAGSAELAASELPSLPPEDNVKYSVQNYLSAFGQ